MELLHQAGEIINQRYRILNTLGQGGVGITYEAKDLQSGQQVALKVLSLRRMSEWKKIELFEREARILSQLNHPAIPRYLDYLQVDTPQDRCFYIAQQLAPGKSLAVLVESGWHPDEAEVRRLATQVLEILIYLHSLTPPVIHRDIKPQNIIRRSPLLKEGEGVRSKPVGGDGGDGGDRGENSSSSSEAFTRPTAYERTQGEGGLKEGCGDLFLVDFGAVQDTYHNTVTGGSTVVGTYGYMAPEQFRGQAVLSTDLYGLGTTLLFLLTGKSPADLPQRKLKIDFRPHVGVSKDFADWLERMLEPAIADRFPSANVALAVLQGQQPLTSYSIQRPRRPKNSAITLSKTEEQLVVEIPARHFRSNLSLIFALLVLFGNGFLLLMFWVILGSISWANLGLSFSFLTFLGIYAPFGRRMLDTFILSPISRTRLTIERDNFCLQRWLLGWRFQKVKGRTSKISRVELSGIKPMTVCVLRQRMRKRRFGSCLTQPEKEWLVWEIKAFLEKMR